MTEKAECRSFVSSPFSASDGDENRNPYRFSLSSLLIFSGEDVLLKGGRSDKLVPPLSLRNRRCDGFFTTL